MFSFLSPAPPPSPFEPPSLHHQLLNSPLTFLVRRISALLVSLRGAPFPPPPSSTLIRLVCISDTHTHKPTSLPPGDILVHAGDLTNSGTAAEIQEQIDWLNSLPHKYKVVIAGNHDSYLDPRSRHESDRRESLDWGRIHYLQHSSLALKFPDRGNRQVHIYGAPQIPECGGPEFAFQYQRENDAWSATIPPETDILVTHTPPRFHLDLPRGMGCRYLLKEVWGVRPKVHVFGHVHAGYGTENVFWDKGQMAYERLCEKGGCGLVRNLIGLRIWMDAAQIIYHGILGILWARVWGAESTGTVMVNAALSYRSTGQLGNLPQVVDM